MIWNNTGKTDADGSLKDEIQAKLQGTKNISFISFSSKQISTSLTTSKINDQNQREFGTL